MDPDRANAFKVPEKEVSVVPQSKSVQTAANKLGFPTTAKSNEQLPGLFVKKPLPGIEHEKIMLGGFRVAAFAGTTTAPATAARPNKQRPQKYTMILFLDGIEFSSLVTCAING